MLAGSAASLWFFQGLRDRTRKVAEAERRVTAVVRLNNSLVTLMSRLHRAADNRQSDYFRAEATRLLAAFRLDTANATEEFRHIAPATGRESVLVDSFNQMLVELPSRIQSLVQLADAHDWLALHARLTDQVDHTDDVAEALTREADADLSEAQKELSEHISEAERRAMASLAIGGLFAFFAAALLGMMATRSITEPLARLDAGARALARGDFNYRVGLSGNNELAKLGEAFDHTAHELARLYAQVRNSEEQLRLITDSLPVLISYVDREHRYVFSNQHHEQWFNQSRQQLAGARVEDVMGNGAYRSFHDGIERALGGQMVTYETTLCHESDGERHVRTILVPDFDEQKTVRGFVSLVEDITADKRTEDALRASEERLQEFLVRENEARNTAELLNQIGRVLSAELDENRLAQSLTDIATQLVGAQFGGLFFIAGSEQCLVSHSGAAREAVERMALLSSTPLWPAPDVQQAVRSENIHGHASYMERVSPLDSEKGYQPVSSYLAVSVVSRTRDVLGTLLFGHSGENKFSQAGEDLIAAICAQAAISLDNAHLFKRLNSANRALQESNQALQRANEDLNVFAFSASHDLQEPLRNISLYSQMLQRKYGGKLDSQSDEFIKYLVEGAGRMSELIRDLLAYIQASNIHTEGVSVIPAALAVEKALSSLKTAVLTSKATVIYGDLPEVATEAVHLQQLFQNLISNAIKYRSDKQPEICIAASDKGEFWEFSVKDNGLGIDPQYNKQIFKPFKRLHGRASHPGTGIGLAICQKIVDRYGGRIWINSQPGKGSDFRFTLPKPGGILG